MGADEKFVRASWEHVRSWVRDLDSYGTDQFNVSLHYDEDAAKYGGDYFQRWQEDDTRKGHNAVWSSAAEFTRSRLEEIRQVEEEIRLLEGYNKSNKSCSENSFAELRSREQHATSFITVRRTIVRLHAALAELKRGMR